MGDFLSRQYTGTDSTISQVSQKGNEDLIDKLAHKVTSLTRVVYNTLTHNTDQYVIDVLLGKSAAKEELANIESTQEREWVERELIK